MPENTSLFLASASPRRRELMDQLHCQYKVVEPNIDESRLIDESAADYVSRVAMAKAVAAWPLISRQSDRVLLLAADTCIALDDDIIGKPDDAQHAQRILSRLSGRWHEVYSAVAVIDAISYNGLCTIDLDTEKLTYRLPSNQLRCNKTRVSFRELSQQDIQAYCDTGEPMGKAGAYAIQGRAAGFIKEIQGSYSAVMGLPLYETAEILRLNGFIIMDVKNEH